MKNFTSLKNICFYGVSLILLTGGLYSCGSSQQAYNEGDGIYGSPQTKGEVVMVRDTKSDYYQNYFAGENQNSQEIFTDIDAYEGYNDTDTIYVENQYSNGNPPWEQSSSNVTISFNMGFGGYYGWGYPYYGYGYGWGYPGYGWGYPGYGWGYPGYGWGYPGYGWGYPGYGWGYPGYGWGHYPPYYPGYYERATYGKRYANNSGSINGNYGRMNTRNISTENKFNRAYSRSANSRNVASSYGTNSRGSSSRYGTTQGNNNRSYQNRSSYNRANSSSNYRNNSSGNNSGSYKRSAAPASRSYSSPSSRSGSSGMRSGSSGMRSGSSGMRSSSGRRQMSYNNMDSSPTSSNRKFVKKTTSYESAASNERVSYTTAKNSNTYQRYVKYAPADGVRGNSSSARSYSGNSNASSGRSAMKNAGTSQKSTSRSSNNRSSYSGSSGSSRSSFSSSSVKPARNTSSGGATRSNR